MNKTLSLILFTFSIAALFLLVLNVLYLEPVIYFYSFIYLASTTLLLIPSTFSNISKPHNEAHTIHTAEKPFKRTHLIYLLALILYILSFYVSHYYTGQTLFTLYSSSNDLPRYLIYQEHLRNIIATTSSADRLMPSLCATSLYLITAYLINILICYRRFAILPLVVLPLLSFSLLRGQFSHVMFVIFFILISMSRYQLLNLTTLPISSSLRRLSISKTLLKYLIISLFSAFFIVLSFYLNHLDRHSTQLDIQQLHQLRDGVFANTGDHLLPDQFVYALSVLSVYLLLPSVQVVRFLFASSMPFDVASLLLPLRIFTSDWSSPHLPIYDLISTHNINYISPHYPLTIKLLYFFGVPISMLFLILLFRHLSRFEAYAASASPWSVYPVLSSFMLLSMASLFINDITELPTFRIPLLLSMSTSIFLLYFSNRKKSPQQSFGK